MFPVSDNLSEQEVVGALESEEEPTIDVSTMPPVSKNNGNKNEYDRYALIDCRDYYSACANLVRGGGYESSKHYGTDPEYMNMQNIHYVRSYFEVLSEAVQDINDNQNLNFLTVLDNAKWLFYLSQLMEAAKRVSQLIVEDKKSVLVHCSDGWDRTPQITALTQICIDPYYRTFEGFEVLVQKEWVEFGHKFGDRCANAGSKVKSDSNERSPVFLQWIDAVHQLLIQNINAFEFNVAYLVKLSQHIYSDFFGTFLCNSSHDRKVYNVMDNTYDIWALFEIDKARYTNNFYRDKSNIIIPKSEIKHLHLWKDVYITPSSPISSNASNTFAENGLSISDDDSRWNSNGDLPRSRSHDNLHNGDAYPFSTSRNNARKNSISSSFGDTITRHNSDPNLSESVQTNFEIIPQPDKGGILNNMSNSSSKLFNANTPRESIELNCLNYPKDNHVPENASYVPKVHRTRRITTSSKSTNESFSLIESVDFDNSLKYLTESPISSNFSSKDEMDGKRNVPRPFDLPTTDELVASDDKVNSPTPSLNNGEDSFSNGMGSLLFETLQGKHFGDDQLIGIDSTPQAINCSTITSTNSLEASIADALQDSSVVDSGVIETSSIANQSVLHKIDCIHCVETMKDLEKLDLEIEQYTISTGFLDSTPIVVSGVRRSSSNDTNSGSKTPTPGHSRNSSVTGTLRLVIEYLNYFYFTHTHFLCDYTLSPTGALAPAKPRPFFTPRPRLNISNGRGVFAGV